MRPREWVGIGLCSAVGAAGCAATALRRVPPLPGDLKGRHVLVGGGAGKETLYLRDLPSEGLRALVRLPAELRSGPDRGEGGGWRSRGLRGLLAGVQVKSGTQAAELPGSIVFEATPRVPKAGEAFRVVAFLSNQGTQPIALASMSVATTVDGRTQRGPIPPATATVAPGQRAPVFQAQGLVWKESTPSWVMEILLTTQRGETYRNTLTWK